MLARIVGYIVGYIDTTLPKCCILDSCTARSVTGILLLSRKSFALSGRFRICEPPFSIPTLLLHTLCVTPIDCVRLLGGYRIWCDRLTHLLLRSIEEGAWCESKPGVKLFLDNCAWLRIVETSNGELAMANQIDCIEKNDRYDPTEAITHIGGVNADGGRWRITQQDAIERIEKGTNSFYVAQDGRRTNVVVSVSRFGNKYIKTEADDYEPNNLLSLKSCRLVS